MERPADTVNSNGTFRVVMTLFAAANKNPLDMEGIVYKAFVGFKLLFQLDGRLGLSLGLDCLQWVVRIKNGFLVRILGSVGFGFLDILDFGFCFFLGLDRLMNQKYNRLRSFIASFDERRVGVAKTG